MTIIHCSAEKPWGIHTALEANHCPRCGWDADSESVAELASALPALTVIEGGLSIPQAAAA